MWFVYDVTVAEFLVLEKDWGGLSYAEATAQPELSAARSDITMLRCLGAADVLPAMESRGPQTVLFTQPDTDELAALAVAARYLSRAGTAADSRLLGLRIDLDEAALMAAMRDNLRAGAALCDGLLDAATVMVNRRDRGKPRYDVSFELPIPAEASIWAPTPWTPWDRRRDR